MFMKFLPMACALAGMTIVTGEARVSSGEWGATPRTLSDFMKGTVPTASLARYSLSPISELRSFNGLDVSGALPPLGSPDASAPRLSLVDPIGFRRAPVDGTRLEDPGFVHVPAAFVDPAMIKAPRIDVTDAIAVPPFRHDGR